MKFKVGDKVKFLNEPGGGIVSKVISTSMVNVTIEDGFDIPVLSSELVKIEDNGHTAGMFREDFNVDIAGESINGSLEEESRISILERRGRHGISEEAVFIAFHPHNQQWLVTGMLDIYVINNTDTEILFSLFIKNQGKEAFENIDYGSLNPFSKYLIETINHDQILKWNQGIVQILFMPERIKQIFPPVSADFSVKSSTFAIESQYREAGFLSGKSVMVKLSAKPVIVEEKKEKPDHEPTVPVVKKAEIPKERQLIEPYMTGRDEAVVDLHIGQIVDDLTDLSPHDMLQAQVDHFTRCLENAMKNRLRKVTFIHGVGNGILRDAIVEKMKDYESLEHQSASLAKFGVGAVDVRIRNPEQNV
jgi:hypothetical protein